MSFHGVSYGPRIQTGPGSLAALGAELRRMAGAGAPVLLVADAGLVPFGIVNRAAAALIGHAVTVYAEIAGEPKEAQVEAARRLGRSAGVQAVVCLGGGSALDAGKLAAALLASEEPVSAFRLAAQPLPEKPVPVICVPTTAGTGSEMTGVSVVSDAAKTKFWFWGEPLQADLALLDPELTVGLPPRFTAMTGMDALVHAIEAATNRNAGPESDVAALAAIRLVMAHLPTAVREPANIEARAAMLDAAALGGLAIHKAGTALAHNIGHALGSLAPVPHGHAVTLAMAATAEWVVEGNRAAYAKVAEAMGLGADPDAVPHAFRRLATEIGLSLDASAAAPGLTPERLAAAMAAPENASMRKSTKRLIADEDLLPLAEMTLALGRSEERRFLLPEGEGGCGAAG
jgi:alcohol dehydrogenase class IV